MYSVIRHCLYSSFVDFSTTNRICINKEILISGSRSDAVSLCGRNKASDEPPLVVIFNHF